MPVAQHSICPVVPVNNPFKPTLEMTTLTHFSNYFITRFINYWAPICNEDKNKPTRCTN